MFATSQINPDAAIFWVSERKGIISNQLLSDLHRHLIMGVATSERRESLIDMLTRCCPRHVDCAVGAPCAPPPVVTNRVLVEPAGPVIGEPVKYEPGPGCPVPAVGLSSLADAIAAAIGDTRAILNAETILGIKAGSLKFPRDPNFPAVAAAMASGETIPLSGGSGEPVSHWLLDVEGRSGCNAFVPIGRESPKPGLVGLDQVVGRYTGKRATIVGGSGQSAVFGRYAASLWWASQDTGAPFPVTGYGMGPRMLNPIYFDWMRRFGAKGTNEELARAMYRAHSQGSTSVMLVAHYADASYTESTPIPTDQQGLQAFMVAHQTGRAKEGSPYNQHAVDKANVAVRLISRGRKA